MSDINPFTTIDLSDLYKRLGLPDRRVFVSYHHGGDKYYYEVFSKIFCDQYEIFQDNSMERAIDSDIVEYVWQSLRDNFLTGTSCTIVLCGAETPGRKFVDWEIKGTLDKGHGLIGVWLPSARLNFLNQPIVPDRLYDNWLSGYAVWTTWIALITNPVSLKNLIEQAISRPKASINNSRPMRMRNS